MPTRVIRDGIISSERVKSLSERAELFYRKLQSVVDDYGRFFSNPISILGACYPMRPEVCESDVKQFLSDCVAAKLVVIYGGGKYLQILDFKQQVRSRSKFPEPTKNELLIKSKADEKQMSRVGEGEGEGEGEGDKIDKGLEIFNAIEVRVSALFKRPKQVHPSHLEQSALSEISRRTDVLSELEEIERFHKKPDNFFPQSVQKLLSTWQDTLDRARTHDERKKSNANNRTNAPDRNAGTFNAKPLSAAAKSKVL